MTRPLVKSSWGVVLAFFSVAGIVTVPLLFLHPEVIPKLTQGFGLKLSIAEVVSLVILVSYGLRVDRKGTLAKVTATVIALPIGTAFAAYLVWLDRVVPAKGLFNFLALFEGSKLSWGVRFGLLPTQGVVALMCLGSVAILLCGAYSVLSEVCKYGAQVRAKEAGLSPEQN